MGELTPPLGMAKKFRVNHLAVFSVEDPIHATG